MLQIHTVDALTFLAATTTHAAFWKRKEKNDLDERRKEREIIIITRVNRDFTAEGQLTAAMQVTLTAQCKMRQLPRQYFVFGFKLQSFLLQYVHNHRTKCFQMGLKSKAQTTVQI